MSLLGRWALSRKENQIMKYYIGEPGSTGRYFDTLEDFVKAITDLADTYENEGEEVFEIEVVRN